MNDPLNFIKVDRYWFLTWTTYGSWLPGDARGFVGQEVNEFGHLVDRNHPGDPLALPRPGLNAAAQQSMTGNTVVFDFSQAEALFSQFQETTSYRGWLLVAVGIMRTHIHAVIGVPGDPEPEKILGTLKAYGSRRLNARWICPGDDSWWTEGGSKRKLDGVASVEAAVAYIRNQPNPLLIWIRGEGFIVPR